MRRLHAVALAVFLAAGGVIGACGEQPNDSEVVPNTSDGGLAGYGEVGFACGAPLTPQSCCGIAGCAPSWALASSCSTVASTPAPYVLDSSPCEGLLEARQGTTYMLFDATTGALVALLAGPGPQSDGFTCTRGPAAFPVVSDCLVHWQQASASDPCTDAGTTTALPDAGCALDAPAE